MASCTGVSGSKSQRTDNDVVMNGIEMDLTTQNDDSASCNSSPEFVSKKRKSVMLKNKNIKLKKRRHSNSEGVNGDATSKSSDTASQSKLAKSDTNQDIFCWICHRPDGMIPCSTCPRSFHLECIANFTEFNKNELDTLVCPECISTMVSECNSNLTGKWKCINQSELNDMLKFVILRMYYVSGSNQFYSAVDENAIKDYYTIIKNPMYLERLKARICNNEYYSPEAFYSDFKWIYHNCIVYNGANSLFTNYVKNLEKVCVKELGFMKSCPDCYRQRMPFMTKILKEQGKASPAKVTISDKPWEFSFNEDNIDEMWMTKLCDNVHPLVWVRLHNYPVWPGKLIALDEESALVFFFGDYDLNIVPLGSMCVHTQSNHKRLTSNIMNLTNRRSCGTTFSPNSVTREYQLALEQLNTHLEIIRRRYPSFVIPPKKIEYNIQKGVEYYEKLSIKTKYDNDTVVFGGNDEIPSRHDSITQYSDKYDMKSDLDKSDKYEANSTASMMSFNPNSVGPREQNFSYSFINKFESGVLQLLDQLRKDSSKFMNGSKSTACVLDDIQPNFVLSDVTSQPVRDVPKPVPVTNAAVQFSSKEFQKEDDLKKYISYLERCLSSADIEIRRQEILSAVRHEEYMLEFAKQQKELKKIYETDLVDIIKNVRLKMEDKFSRTVRKLKSSEWCAFCGKAARFYCCWNTCYCGHDCQSKHWETHKSSCSQVQKPQPLPRSNSINTTPLVQNSPNVIQHILSRPTESTNVSVGINGSTLIDYMPNVTQKQRFQVRR